MNANVIGNATGSPSSTLSSVQPGRPEAEVGRGPQSDLPLSKQVRAVARTDRVEISDVNKTLAVLKEQATGNEPQLQLSPRELQEMAST